ncbi:unnamed protein product [Ectocarpus sp. CCAP 1310/34]|nr:unnamed protein product [Ectocarpus sp. CCAP 1310/34]
MHRLLWRCSRPRKLRPWAALQQTRHTPSFPYSNTPSAHSTQAGAGLARDKAGTGQEGTQGIRESRHSRANVSDDELEKFRHLEKEWWNPASRQGAGPLHSMNVTRVQYIVRQVGLSLPEASPLRGSATPLAGLRALDVGCGGGLLSESLARLGAEVIGVDPSPENVAVASAHAQGDSLTRTIRYEATTAKELENRGEQFDLVASLEVIEHVEDPAGFVSSLASLTRPGGMLAMSTINRTAKSFALAIVGAEYLAGIVPVGTHDWRKFVPPEDLTAMLQAHGFPGELVETCGLMYNPVSGRWKENPGDLDVNYIVTALRGSGEKR